MKRLFATFTLSFLVVSSGLLQVAGGNLRTSARANIVTVGNATLDLLIHSQSPGMIVLADGKIVTVESGGFGLARYNPDGSPDVSFGGDGKVITQIAAYDVSFGLAPYPDGKIVVVGRSYIESNDFALVRYNSDGSVDESFGSGGIVTTDFNNGYDEAFSVAVQPDEKIIVAGNGEPLFGGTFALVRYNSEGSLDRSFGQEGKVNTTIGTSAGGTAHAVSIQTDGQIVAAGVARDQFDKDQFVVVRYNVDGSLDPSFGEGGRTTTHIRSDKADDSVAYALTLQSDRKIVLAGISFDERTFGFALARYTAEGNLDSTFGTEGKTFTAIGRLGDGVHPFGSQYTHKAGCRVCDVTIQDDGKILVVGSALKKHFDLAIVRYNPDGNLDRTFGKSGKVITPLGGDAIATSVAVQPDRKIVVAGGIMGGKSVVVRYNPDGSLDRTFGKGGKVITRIGKGVTIS